MDVNYDVLNSNVDGVFKPTDSPLCWLRAMAHKVLKHRVQRCSLGKLLVKCVRLGDSLVDAVTPVQCAQQ